MSNFSSKKIFPIIKSQTSINSSKKVKIVLCIFRECQRMFNRTNPEPYNVVTVLRLE